MSIFLLSATPALGCLYLSLLFLFCFVGVHIAKLVERGFEASQKPTEKKEPPKEQKPAPPQPVYYLVEKKRKRASSYEEPKKISFK